MSVPLLFKIGQVGFFIPVKLRQMFPRLVDKVEQPITSLGEGNKCPKNKSLDYRSPPGGGATPLYKVYRYVSPQTVWFLSRFGLKTGIDF